LSIFNELKRRKVFKVGIAYILIAWLVAQALHLVFESFGTPDWAIKTVLVLLVAGFPLALFFAWAYEMTPEGIKRDHEARRLQSPGPGPGRKLSGVIVPTPQLRSLVYKSRSTGPVTRDLVDSILDSSIRNNPEEGITGVLIATEKHFLQVLEGGYEELNATYERIARDTRHDTLQLISFSEIEERQFGDWAMHGIGLFDLNRDVLAKLYDKFGEDNGSLRFPSTVHGVMDLLDMLSVEDHAG
jgi:hypothetical protein